MKRTSKDPVYGFDICLYQALYHNNKFVVNVVSNVRIVAQNDVEAMKKVKLKPANEFYVGKLHVSTGPQWIHDVVCLGRAYKKMITEFDPSDQPESAKPYKEQ